MRGAPLAALLWAALLLVSSCAPPAPKAAPAPAHAAPARPVGPPTITFRYFAAPVYYRDEVVVLMLHDIAPHPQPYTDEITPATFQADLELLRRDHFNVIPASLLADFLEHKAQVPPNAVLLTFDDGYQGVYTYGFPLLERYRVPATCFIITGFVQGPHQKPWTMSWAELERMYASGLVSLQSHTYDSHGAVRSGPATTGPALTDSVWDPATRSYETPAHYRQRIGQDLARARRELEQHLPGARVDMFAYPFGAYDPTVIRILRRDGYRFAFTTYGGAATSQTDPYRIFRINVGTWHTTPQALVAAARDTGIAMAAHPGFQAPARVVPSWR